jgi:hypothetical protein
MPITTPYLGLKEYDIVTDASALNINFQDAVAGTSASSNMSLIDAFATTISGSIVSLQQNVPTIYVNGVIVSGNYFIATVSAIASYVTNMTIILKLSNNVTGSTTLKINSLATITLKKTDNIGNLQDIGGGDLKRNFNYMFRYDGTYWVMVSGVTMNNVSTGVGTVDNIVSISSQGVLDDSGYGFDGTSGVATLSSGFLRKAELGSGVASASSVLMGDNSWRLKDQMLPLTIVALTNSQTPLKLRAASSAMSSNMLEIQNSTSSVMLAVASNGRDIILDTSTGTKIGTSTSQKLSVWNANPITQPTVSGSTGGNEALMNLITALASFGIIVDGTTVL